MIFIDFLSILGPLGDPRGAHFWEKNTNKRASFRSKAFLGSVVFCLGPLFGKRCVFFRDELVLILKRFNVQVLNVLKTNLFQIYVHMKHAGLTGTVVNWDVN